MDRRQLCYINITIYIVGGQICMIDNKYICMKLQCHTVQFGKWLPKHYRLKGNQSIVSPIFSVSDNTGVRKRESIGCLKIMCCTTTITMTSELCLVTSFV